VQRSEVLIKNASALPDARSGCGVNVGEELLARPVKPFGGGPPVVAADAGPMQIQLWEGTVLRCAEAAPRSMTRQTVDLENG
jgi:hypothetical protein